MVPPMSRSPATTSSWSAMVAITGYGVAGSNSVLLAPASPARFRATSMATHCRPRHRPSSGILWVRAWVTAPIFPSIPPTPHPPRTTPPSTPPPLLRVSRSCASLAPSAVPPEVVALGVLADAAAPQPPARREVGAGQAPVLPPQRDGAAAARPVPPPQQVVPVAPVHVAERQV